MASSAVVGLLRVLLTANTAEFSSAMKKSSEQARVFSRDMRQIGSQMQSVGTALTKTLTLPIAGLGVAVAKAAIDFESSFAGVRKTVDATEAEFSDMAKAFRGLAKEIPINVNELNRLGEAAGALGIPKQEVVSFAKVMAQLGVTTNLTSDQAADAIARIQNIFGAAGKDTDRLASTIVALGNAGASTESEITEMAQRIAGAGHAIGLTQAQVVAFASTLASVGINAEAGGSAISRVFLKMNDAVAGGGAKLAEFARVAGMSAAQFKQAFETDAAQAANAFITGLGRLKTSGENINQTIEGLTGKNIILKDTLFRLSGAGGELARQLGVADQAWRDNTALTEEARKRFETTASQLQLLWNRIKDVGITLGDALLPTIKSISSALSAMLPWIESAAKLFASLPQPIQTMVVLFGAAVAAAGPLLYIFGTLARSAGDVAAAFTRKGIATRALSADLVALQGTSTLATTALKLLGAAAAVASAALIGWEIGRLISDLLGLETQAERTARRLEQIAEAKAKIAGAGNTREILTGQIAELTAQMHDPNQLDRIGGEAAAALSLRLESLRAQLDVITKATKNGAAAAITYGDAIKYNANIEAVRIGTIDKSVEAQKRSIQALLDLGKITKQQADQMLGRLVPATRASADANNDAADAGKKHADAIAALVAKMSGSGAIKAATDLEEALRALPPIQNLTRESQLEIVKAMDEAIAVYQAAGKTIPASWLRIRDAAKAASTDILKVVRDTNAKIIESMQLGSIRWGTIAFDPKFEDATWATRSTLIGKNLTNTFVSGAEQINVEQVRAAAAKRVGEALKDGPGFFAQAFGSTKQLGADLSNAIIGALQGGGNVFASVAGIFGQKIGTQLSESLAGSLAKDGVGKFAKGFGNMLAGALPIIGSLAGPLISGLWNKLFSTAGRDAVKDFAATFAGGFDGPGGLHDTLLKQLGPLGEDLWKELTQQVGRGDKEKAQAVIAKIQGALADAAANSPEALASAAGYKTRAELQATADKAKQVYDYMVASGQYSADQIADAFKKMSEAQIAAMDDASRAAYDAAVAASDNAKKVLDELDSQIHSLQQSIDAEAVEEVMGAQETLDRARLEALKKQREEAQKNLDDANAAIQQAADAAVAAAQEAAKKAGQATVDAVREALAGADFEVTVKTKFDPRTGGADGYSRGGVVPQYRAGGGDILRAFGFRPRGTDTVPAMLTPGETVLTEGMTGRIAQTLRMAQDAAVAGMRAIANVATFRGSGGASDARLAASAAGGRGELTAKVPVALYLDQFSRDALTETIAKVVLVG